ncbi:hypothetical protein BO71DRAFT_211130 [Aspergillus ellipticus CBS 707.79]|uniref:Uncharacterized protein n=1 Tax=Aspergillus ellipticus CBS 707.79 TaxID=1448320 RepID=A0A319DD03_9EURO|nr:hypothetical protein BO71DRAFT_211130 [Aspergillus ellipticus CBS 707.79]
MPVPILKDETRPSSHLAPARLKQLVPLFQIPKGAGSHLFSQDSMIRFHLSAQNALCSCRALYTEYVVSIIVAIVVSAGVLVPPPCLSNNHPYDESTHLRTLQHMTSKRVMLSVLPLDLVPGLSGRTQAAFGFGARRVDFNIPIPQPSYGVGILFLSCPALSRGKRVGNLRHHPHARHRLSSIYHIGSIIINQAECPFRSRPDRSTPCLPDDSIHSGSHPKTTEKTKGTDD